ncbi:MAG: cysteine desulfurase [Crocinitomicaceae bacterium]|nr:cysteine desulfurase [Crocinitomicaceae bacterium]
MRVYLDNAATTPMAPEVIAAMVDVYQENFGNASSAHYFGRNSKALLENSRRSIARWLNCQSSELIFTSGGTEADNMALYAAVEKLGVKRIITTHIEHHAVGHTAESLYVKFGTIITNLSVDEKGNIDLNELSDLLADTTPTLVSLMHANNEISTMIPLKEIGLICRKHGAYFHSDTVQTMGHYSFDLNELGIDFITCAAHKFHGPKGVGFLYVNKATKVAPFIYGGAQERGLRGGTENIAGIVGLSKAFDLAYENLAAHQAHVQGLKSYMIEQLTATIPGVSFHGETANDKSLYTVLNVCFPPTEKASMVLFTLDLKGIAVSGGSACSSGASTGSHVLSGIKADMTRPNVRFSFSHYTTKEEIDYTLAQVKIVFQTILV